MRTAGAFGKRVPCPSRYPPQSSLRQLKQQAKDLRKACDDASPEALARFRDHHPRHLGAADAVLAAASLPLQDAQLVIAREYGYDSWPKLVEAVGEIGREPGLVAPPDLVGASLATAWEQIRQSARLAVPVLLTGERGVGKRHVARLLHEHSGRDGRLAVVSCDTKPGALGESEIFGFEEGAFTGALVSTPGLLEALGDGTLVLDEVGSLSMAAQLRLFQWLETGSYRRLGGAVDLASQVRVVCTTSHDLKAKVRDGEFREDLYFRLQVLRIDLPALRDRRDDISSLVLHFARVADANAEAGFSAAALQALQEHEWPGNVRELRHVVEAAILARADDEVDVGDLRLDAGTSASEQAA